MHAAQHFLLRIQTGNGTTVLFSKYRGDYQWHESKFQITLDSKPATWTADITSWTAIYDPDEHQRSRKTSEVLT